MHFYIRHLGDYARDTATLSALEVGVYDLFLDFYYSTEKPLPLNRDDLKKLARSRNVYVVNAVDKVLALFFTETESGYMHKRVEEEIAKAKAKSSKAAASAAARWEAQKRDANASGTDMKSNANADANASSENMRTHSEGNASQDSNTKTIGTKLSSSKARACARKPAELAALLRQHGVSDAQATHALVRQWAVDAAVSDAVLSEALARLSQRHDVLHPMSYLARIVPDVLADFAAGVQPANVHALPVRMNGQRLLTPAQEYRAACKAVHDGIRAGLDDDERKIDAPATIDIAMKEISDERAKK